jgi:predicted phosphodiesterase
MRVLLVGDVHGRLEQLAEVLGQAQADFRIAAAIQVGDFGFYKAGIARARERRTRFAVPLHVIDGNHEDHRWLAQALRSGAAGAWRDELNLIYQPRPSLACFGASKVGFLGGALHVDRPQRHNLLAGLPNYILQRQRERAAVLFNRERCDLIVTHSCPAGIGIGLTGPLDLRLGVLDYIVGAGFDPGPVHDCGETELTRLWRGLDYRPAAWVFGHHHRLHATTVRETHFVCVGEAESAWRQPVLWDSDALVLWTLAR